MNPAIDGDPIGALVQVIEARREPWRRRAACAGVPVDMFFPGLGENTQAAKAICAGCPVRSECLESNLLINQGVYGGLSRMERRRLRGALAPCRTCGVPVEGRTSGVRYCPECRVRHRAAPKERYRQSRKAVVS